jgi:hypothetical protein
LYAFEGKSVSASESQAIQEFDDGDAFSSTNARQIQIAGIKAVNE